MDELRIYDTIDGRELQPPEPFDRTLAAIAGMPPGHALVLLAPCEPRPLFRFLRLNGYDYRCVYEPGGWFEVRMWHSADTASSSEDLQ
jgi:hypothetical protein